MTLNSKLLASLIAFILLGGIIFSGMMGWWQTESTKEAATFTTGEFAGQANPEDIRGSYTFGDVERNFGVPANILAQAFGVKVDEPAGFQVKSLEEIYADSPEEIGTSSVRLFVAFYLGMPYDLSSDIYLPEAAAAYLSARNLASEQVEYLETHTLLVSSGNLSEDEAPLLPDPSQNLEIPIIPDNPAVESNVLTVNGKTTFGDLIEWGISRDVVEKVLGMDIPASTGMTVKDFCTENGLSFETVKVALQNEVEQLP